jgi:hypothetical protein
LLKGLDVGDPRVDALPLSAVCCHGGQARKIGTDPQPAWVNWDSVRRGQEVFKSRIGQAYFALTFALLQGFSIARFAEVLNYNGYAQNGETAFERYRETSFAIIDWMNNPLDDENSKAHSQLQNVRAMHSFARRRSMKLFDKSKGEGIALSQYDVAEVQLGFAGITPNLLAHEFKIKLSKQEMEDWCHVWRIIGYHLGIQDEFNCCNSVEDLEAMTEEYMDYVPLRFKTCRPATFALQRTALEGFGKYSGVGVEFFSGMLHASCESRDWGTDLDYLERPCHPGLKMMGKFVFPLFGNSLVNRMLNWSVMHMRTEFAEHPERAKRTLPRLAAISRLNDAVLWPIVGWSFVNAHAFFASKLRKVVFAYFVGLLSMHYIGYKLIWQKIIKRVIQLARSASFLTN